jgi:hypothetical protein
MDSFGQRRAFRCILITDVSKGDFKNGPDLAEDVRAHGAWLRRLARGLTIGDAGVEDVVQETWAAAIRRAPGPAEERRPWLEPMSTPSLASPGTPPFDGHQWKGRFGRSRGRQTFYHGITRQCA